MVAEGLKSLLPDEFELVGIVDDGRAMTVLVHRRGGDERDYERKGEEEAKVVGIN
jgi:hypothetical protein